MKLTSARVQNFQILTFINLAFQTPITLLSADMEQGKSSFGEAVRMALTGEPTRVKLKKNYPDLIRDSAKDGSVALEWLDNNGALGTTGLSLPTGTIEGIPTFAGASLLPFLLDPPRIAALPAPELRELLYSLSGGRPDAAAISKMLVDRGHDATKSAEVGPIIVSSFEAGRKHASNRASEARTAWKDTTGENYGSAKAKDWQAPCPPFDPDAIDTLEAEVDELDTKLAAANERVGRLTATADAARERQEKISHWQTVSGLRGQRSDDIADREQERADAEKKVQLARDAAAAVAEASGGQTAGNGLAWFAKTMLDVIDSTPGAFLDDDGATIAERHPEAVATGRTALEAYIKARGEPVAVVSVPDDIVELAGRLAEYERDLRASTAAVDNARRALEQCDLADAMLHELGGATESTNDNELELARAAREAIAAAKVAKDAELQAMRADRAAAEQSESITMKAAWHHQDVTEWSAIAAALAPDGIPSEEAGKHLKPFNNRLRNTAMLTGWDQVSVDGDAQVRINGRLYGMCSESARWRADAALVEAVAFLSGLKFFMLDRVDVLSIPGRRALMVWLHKLAVAGEIETALLMGTFKEPPSGLPAATITVHWLEQGALAEFKRTA